MQVEKSKVGQFFIFIGLILLVIFFASGQAAASGIWHIFWPALGLLFLGGYLYLAQTASQSDPNTARFRTVAQVARAQESARRAGDRDGQKKKQVNPN